MKRTHSYSNDRKPYESVADSGNNYSKRPKTIVNSSDGQYGYAISFGKLKHLVSNHANNPNVLLLNLSKERSFRALISDDNRLKGNDGNYIFLTVIVEVLATICDSDRDILLPFIARVCDTDFHQPILNYLMRFEAFVNPVIVDAKNRELHINAFSNLVTFVRQIQIMLPQSSRDKTQLIVLGLSHALEICNKKDDIIKQSTVDLLKQIKSENTLSDKSLDEKAAKDEKMHAILKPPNNFREVSICPTHEDIHGIRKPFLRRNLIKGKYFDVDHYLDVQFRLLREDYVRPLRVGIASYLNAIKDNKRVTKLKDVRVYSNVRIRGSQLKDDLIFEAVFDVSQLQSVRWQMSNRLLPGSLLCLSHNDFQTFWFATVTGQRIVEKLEKGFVSIKLETQSVNENFNNFNPLLMLTMVESQAYFESYRHNLQALQTFNSENFPLQDYIISVSSVIQNLPYLNQKTAYDLTDLAYPLIKVDSSEFNAIKDTHNSLNLDNKLTLFDTYKSNSNIDSDGLKLLENVLVLDNNSWPEHEVLGFDELQFEAFRAALTKQLVIIQGPPGTGKTYIGLRIVQTLLRNSRHWNGERNFNNNNNNNNGMVDENLFQQSVHKPILIVCYTNHALDQFLEGMLPFCNENHGIVRIGGRSKSELLQSYSLFDLKRKVKQNRVIPVDLYSSMFQSKRELQNYSYELSKLQDNLEVFTKRQITAFELISLSDEHQWIERLVRQLYAYGGNINLGLIYWLSERSNAVTVNVVQHHSRYSSENDEFFMDEQEVQEIINNRIIDNDYNDYDNVNANNNNIGTEATAERVEYHDYDYRDNENYSFSLTLSNRERDKFIKLLEYEMSSNNMMTDEEIAHLIRISTLSHTDRWRLYRRWVNVCCEENQKQIEKVHNDLRIEMRKYNRLKLEEDLCVIRGCDVIGMTTTGAAKYRSIIEQIDPSVVVIEEAAEVLESHVITSLTKSTNHLILIGDHQQLKPNPNVYELAKKFKLDVSLFERMINNGIPYYQLKLQHRMRPCISSLLVPHFYKELRDHHSVNTYENIKGVSKNMYFLNHNESENYFNESRSKFNDFEAKFVVYLCKYLIQQQYKPSQITILVMYSAQLFRVRNFMREHSSVLSGVRVSVIDNYQGEENDIIILSFVRSNSEGSIGFLQIANRVNVALSRAKMGLYCIGNFDCLAEQSQLWKNIKKDIEEQQAIGSYLEIFCQNHSTVITKVSKASHFSKVPEGGCTQPCEYRLNCGHVCTRACHVYDRKHEMVICTKICGHQYEKCDHRCASVCHWPKECEPCKEKVLKTGPNCGHRMFMVCSYDPLKAVCNFRCERMLACGHKCTNLCGNACDPLECKEKVKIISQCGHEVNISCAQQNDTEKLLSICGKKCGALLKCGHRCDGTCTECQQNRLHVKCTKKCARVLVCGHVCKAVCGDNCPPCREWCQTRCYHSRCKRNCGEPCPPCLEQCVWKCAHKRCTRKCSEKCDRELCTKPCRKKLECGHSCIGICGDVCPNKCRICDKKQVQKLLFGNEDEPNARFIQLEDCKHILELNGMVKWLSMSNSNDNSEAANSDQNSSSVIQLKCCPMCTTVIRRTKVFNSAVQEAARNVESVKTKLFGTVRENEQNRTQLLKNIVRFNREVDKYYKYNIENKTQLRSIAQCLLEITKYKYGKSKVELEAIKAKLNVVKQLARDSERLRRCLFDRKYGKEFADINILIRYAYQRIGKLLKFIGSLIVINDQQVHDLQREMNFIQFLTQIIKVSCSREFVNEESKTDLISAFKLFLIFGPLSEEKKVEIKALVEKAVKLQCGLGLLLEEKNMIVKAMGFTKGHWYKCPNGHVYCITECGGAMQESKCPDCGARIGGSRHALLSDNAVATEMDGSTRPAYDPNAGIDWQRWIND